MVRRFNSEKGNSLTSNSRVTSAGNAAFDVLLHHVQSKNGKRKLLSNEVDATDLEIMRNMLAGFSLSHISKRTGIPLSTIQRRSRRLLDEGFIVPVNHLNFKKFGLRRGILYLKCKNTNLEQAVKDISRISGVETAGAYLGSLDILVNVVYADSKEVLRIIAEIQKLDLLVDVTWSEEIHSMPI